MASAGFLIASALGIGATARGVRAVRKTKLKMERAKKALNKPIQQAQTPEGRVQAAPAVEKTKELQKSLDPAQNKKKRRVNLFETEGGVLGQELSPTQVSKRNTLLGN